MKKSFYFRSFMAVCLTFACIFNTGSVTVKAGGSTYQVTKTEDTLDGICDNDCSLRDAIAVTNAAGAGNIALPAGTYTLTITGSGENANQTGDLDIQADGTFNLHGAGKDQTFIVGSGDRVFDFSYSTFEASLSDLTISSGRAPLGENGGGLESDRPLYLDKVSFYDNQAGAGLIPLAGNGNAGGNGGAISIYSGGLRIFNSDFIINQAGKGSDGGLGGDGGSGGRGGAISFSSNNNLEITHCSFSGNMAGNGGNGKANAFGSSTAGNGGVGGFGGAIFAPILNKTAMINNSYFSSNYSGKGGNGGNAVNTNKAGNGQTGGLGGAIYSLMITNLFESQIFQNRAGEGGTGGNGSITLCGLGGQGGGGGAIYATDTLVLTTDKIYDNFAGAGGSGGSSGADYSCQGGQGGFGGGVFSNKIIYSNGTSIMANHAGYGGVGNSGGVGGGLFANEGEFKNSAIIYNTAGNGSSPSQLMATAGGDGGNGGGVFLSGPAEKTFQFINTTIAYNFAGDGSVGSTGQPSGFGGMGGGIYGGLVHAQLIFSTIYHNGAGSSPDPIKHGKGGGLYNYSGSYLHRMSGSILAQNTSNGTDPDCYGKIENTYGYNLIGVENSPNCTYTPLASDQVGSLAVPLDPLLSSPSASMFYPPYPTLWTPIPGSPALDVIPASIGIDGEVCTQDQQGLTRPQGSGCEIGAVERATQLSGSTGIGQIFLFPTNDTRSITLTVKNLAGSRISDVPVLISAPDSGPSATFSTEFPPVNFGPGPITLKTNINGAFIFFIRKNDQIGPYHITFSGLGQPFTQTVVNYGSYNLALPLVSK
jgi:CSLREA domain-containing protein